MTDLVTFSVAVHGKDRAEAFARGRADGLIPSSCLGFEAFEGPGGPVQMVAIKLLDAYRFKTGAKSDVRSTAEQRAWEWLIGRYSEAEALKMLDAFGRSSVALSVDKGTRRRYLVFNSALEKGERVYLFTGLV